MYNVFMYVCMYRRSLCARCSLAVYYMYTIHTHLHTHTHTHTQHTQHTHTHSHTHTPWSSCYVGPCAPGAACVSICTFVTVKQENCASCVSICTFCTSTARKNALVFVLLYLCARCCLPSSSARIIFEPFDTWNIYKYSVCMCLSMDIIITL